MATPDRRRAVLQGISEELDGREVLAAARTRELEGDRVQVILRLPRWLANDIRVYAERAGLSANQLAVFTFWQLLHGSDSTEHRR